MELCRSGADTNRDKMKAKAKSKSVSLATGQGSNLVSCYHAGIEHGGMALSLKRVGLDEVLGRNFLP